MNEPGDVHGALLALLERAGVPFRSWQHEAVTTSDDAARVRGVSPDTGAKALLVKAGAGFVLLVLPGDRQLDWKAARRALGAREIRFATAEELAQLTGLEKGALPPFGCLFGVPTVVDPRIAEVPLVRFNAGATTASVEMPGSALLDVQDATLAVIAK